MQPEMQARSHGKIRLILLVKYTIVVWKMSTVIAKVYEKLQKFFEIIFFL